MWWMFEMAIASPPVTETAPRRDDPTLTEDEEVEPEVEVVESTAPTLTADVDPDPPVRFDWLHAERGVIGVPVLPGAETWIRVRGRFGDETVVWYQGPYTDEPSTLEVSLELDARLLAAARAAPGEGGWLRARVFARDGGGDPIDEVALPILHFWSTADGIAYGRAASVVYAVDPSTGKVDTNVPMEVAP